MARSRAYARHLFRTRYQKRYRFTKTKMLIGFVLSLFTSIFFGTYIENNGIPILTQSYEAVLNLFKAEETPSTPEQAE